jgi:hypothetical protein
MANTLTLDANWDIRLDQSGNLTLTDPDMSIAQDVASAIRTFLGECWYDTRLGLPYFQSILGKRPPASLVKSKITAAALTVADVLSVTVTSLSLVDRTLTGSVSILSTRSPQPVQVNF